MNKRFKQILMLVFAIALVLPQFRIPQKANAAAASGSNVIYDMQQDSQLVGSAVEYTDALQNSGVKFNVVNNSGAKAIEIFGRTGDYNGVDIKTSLLIAAVGTSFNVQVKGRIPSDAIVPDGSQMLLGESNGSYAWLNNVAVKAGDSFTLEYTIDSAKVATYVAAGTNLRVQSNNASGAFIDKFVVDSIIVTTNLIYDMQQDSQLVGSAVEYTDALQNSGVKFNVVDNSGAKAIEIFGRTGDYNGVDIKTSLLIAAGDTSFNIQVKGRIPSDAIVPDGSQMLLGESNGSYAWLNNVAVKAGDSFILEYTIDPAKVATYVAAGTNLRVQSNNVSGAFIDKFAVDSIIITTGGASTTPTTPTTPSDEVVVAYDLQQDTGLADLVSGGGNTYLQRAGNLTINAVSNTNDTVSLDLSNRTLNYEGIDVKASAIGLTAGSAYTVEMTGHIPGTVTIPKGAQIVLSTAGGSYPTLAEVGAADTFKLSYSGTAAVGTGETAGLRMQADPGLSRFVIDTLVVTVTGGTAMPPKSLSNVPGVHVSLTSNGDSWSGANIILGTDSSVWPFSTGDAVAFTPVKDAKYHLTFNATSTGVTGYRVRWITGNENGGYTAGDGAVVTADTKRTYEVGVTANGLPASFAGAGVVKAQAIDYAIDFTMSGSELAQGLIGNIGIRGTAGSNDFLLNSIKITDDSGKVLVNWSGASSPFVPDDYEWPEAKWDLTLPSLKDAYSKYFKIGNIMEPAQTTDATLTAMYDKQYNAVTAENAMKPENILKNMSSASDLLDPSKYNFASSDQIVQWAKENSQSIHGHTLVWHSQTPAFINTGASGTREAAKANMETFITNVIKHFNSPNLISWDVVNEAFDDNTAKFDGNDWRTGLRTSSPWYVAYAKDADTGNGESGADYMYDAFVFAHLAQDQIGSTATLYYNDYNETYKYEEIALMVEDLNAQWEQDSRYDDRNLIEGIGMQSHFWIGSKPDVNAQEVETAIKRFVETGARISVSELDIPYSANNNYHLDEAKLAEQAQEYGTLFTIYKKYADNIDRVTFWGKADIQSWRGSGMPLLFDNSYRPKSAFWTVIGLDAPISTISPATVTFYTNSQADAKVNVTLNSNTLSAIRKSNVLLVEGKDYSVATASANGTQVVTIKKSYLATLSNNDILTFEFSAGNTADLKVLVTRYTTTDTTPPTGSGSSTSSGSGANSGSTTGPDSGANSGSTEQTPTPEKPLLNSKLIDAEQLKAAVQQALHVNNPVNFSDVPATHWSAKAIQLASQLGIIKGEPNGEFKGSEHVTRAEFAEMIARALGLNTTGTDGSFSDTAGHGADAYIRALHRAGILNGTGDGNFKPDQEITRAEMAAILARTLNMSAANGTKFSDIDGNWAADYINQLSQAGIVNGFGDGKFAPNATATRDQSVAIIIRMLNIVLDLGLDL